VEETFGYPVDAVPWATIDGRPLGSIETQRRRFGYFIGLRGYEDELRKMNLFLRRRRERWSEYNY
jgi:hypothetical protein